jgi:hypothetical protein
LIEHGCNFAYCALIYNKLFASAAKSLFGIILYNPTHLHINL